MNIVPLRTFSRQMNNTRKYTKIEKNGENRKLRTQFKKTLKKPLLY